MAGSDNVFPAGTHPGHGVELLGPYPELSRPCLRFHQVRHRSSGAMGPGGLRALAAVHVANG